MRHLWILLLLFAVGCGFSLRGLNTPLPALFKQSYLVAPEENEAFTKKLKQLMSLNGGGFVDKTQAKINLMIGPLETKKRELVLSSDGKTQEYEYTYTLDVSVYDVSAQKRLGSRHLSVIKNIQLNDSKVLSNEQQQQTTKDIAESALAQSVIHYLRILLK